MLQAYPTKNGTGVSIFGDYGDLKNLYDTVHHIAESLDANNKYQKGQHQLLMNFSYDIRKAYSGQALVEKIKFFGDEKKYVHYGFQLVWPDILIFTNTLRCNTGYIQTNKLHQATLYMLEHIIENALFEYDESGAALIKDFIGKGINILNEFVFIIYQAIHIRFVTDKPGKARFRKIPQLLTTLFSEWIPEHKELMNSLKRSAKEQGCEISDLEFSEFPQITW